ncbi:MAG: hypothetical protein LBI78_07340 [Campylobacteraceae bacterium]|jgi:hypothetical protein|nr:hypothetical protein [Campylobacteraceae bacterium]
MIAWFLTIWSWFSKLSWVAKVVSFFPTIKQYWTFIVIGILVIYISILHFMLLQEENKYLTCRNSIENIEAKLNEAKIIADTKKEYVEKIIEKEVIKYQDKVKYIKEIQIENSCNSTFEYLRANF